MGDSSGRDSPEGQELKDMDEAALRQLPDVVKAFTEARESSVKLLPRGPGEAGR